MLSTIIKKYQTLADFAAMNAGNTSAMFAIALNNGVSITDDVAPGTELLFDKLAALPVNYYTPVVIVTALLKPLKRFQTLLDFAAQFVGSAAAVVDVALRNGFGITDDVEPATELAYDEVDKNVAGYFRKRLFDIITGDVDAIQDEPSGIGYWYITEPEPIFTVN